MRSPNAYAELKGAAPAASDSRALKSYDVEFSAIWTYRLSVEALDVATAYDEAARQYYDMTHKERARESDAFELEFIDAEVQL